MCGIWGILPAPGTTLDNVRKFVVSSLIAGTVRGDHGSGIMMLGEGGIDNIIKGMEDGANLLYRKDGFKALENKAISPLWGIVGHNRAATRGDISDNHSHPFRHGNITLVHNGFVSNPNALPGIEGPIAADRVDSDLLCASMNHSGADIVIPRAYGAFALAWHDQRDNAVRFFRNHQRPLHFMRLGCGGLAFASEGDMLWWVAGRAGMSRTSVRELATDLILKVDSAGDATISKVERPHYPPQPQQNYRRHRGSSIGTIPTTAPAEANFSNVANKNVGVLASIGLNGGMILEFDINSKEQHHNSMVKLSGICTDPTGTNKQVYNAVMFAHDNPMLEAGNSIFVRPAGLFRKNKKDRRGIPPLVVTATAQRPSDKACIYKGPRGVLLNERDWEHAVSLGCCQCRESVWISDHEEIKWMMNETQPLCPKCVKEWKEWGATGPVEDVPVSQRSLQ